MPSDQGRLSPQRLLFKAEALLIERFSLRSGHRGVSLPGCRTRCFHRITPDAMEFVQQFTIRFNSTEVPLSARTLAVVSVTPPCPSHLKCFADLRCLTRNPARRTGGCVRDNGEVGCRYERC